LRFKVSTYSFKSSWSDVSPLRPGPDEINRVEFLCDPHFVLALHIFPPAKVAVAMTVRMVVAAVVAVVGAVGAVGAGPGAGAKAVPSSPPHIIFVVAGMVDMAAVKNEMVIEYT
jgi:hypothetical protein